MVLDERDAGSAARAASRRTRRAGWIAASPRMEDRRRESGRRAGRSATRRRSRPRQRRRLGADLLHLLGVRGEAQAAGPAQRVAGEAGKPVEVLLRQPPVLGRALGAEPLARPVVRHRAAAQREAAVASARALPHAPRVTHAHAQPRLGERQRCRDAVMPAPTISTSARHRAVTRRESGAAGSSRSHQEDIATMLDLRRWGARHRWDASTSSRLCSTSLKARRRAAAPSCCSPARPEPGSRSSSGVRGLARRPSDERPSLEGRCSATRRAGKPARLFGEVLRALTNRQREATDEAGLGLVKDVAPPLVDLIPFIGKLAALGGSRSEVGTTTSAPTTTSSRRSSRRTSPPRCAASQRTARSSSQSRTPVDRRGLDRGRRAIGKRRGYAARPRGRLRQGPARRPPPACTRAGAAPRTRRESSTSTSPTSAPMRSRSCSANATARCRPHGSRTG